MHLAHSGNRVEGILHRNRQRRIISKVDTDKTGTARRVRDKPQTC
jgi:hypothetical protein